MPIDDSHQLHIEETPALVRETLEQFQALLVVDNKEVHTTNKKCDEVQDIFHEAARENAEEFTNPDFRLMFLRTDLFDAKLAVKRFRKYWENRKKLFGQLKSLQHNSVDNMATVDRGYTRLVANHERVVLMDPTRIADSYEIDDILRSMFFVLSQALTNSQEAQKRGFVFLIDCEHALDLKYFDSKLIRKSGNIFNGGFPIRVTAVVIMNLHPVGQWFIAAFRLLMKPAIRNRIRVVKSPDTKQQLDRYAGLNRSELAANVGYKIW